jgi:hypothetical protein
MAETHHRGGCHCGAVRFQVDIDLTQPAITCNCSMCSRAGTMLAFVAPNKFTLDRGAEQLTDYQFNKKVIHHLFCKTCGIKAFARGKGPSGDMVAVNVRCIDDVDLSAVKTQQFDGKSR